MAHDCVLGMGFGRDLVCGRSLEVLAGMYHHT